MKIYEYDAQVNKYGKVTHAFTPSYKRVYPYKVTSKYGCVNCSGEFTPEQVRGRLKRNTLFFQ